MAETEGVLAVPDKSPDARLHVFRRNFEMEGEFAGLEVDAYVLLTQRYTVVFDTLLCPEDAASMLRIVQPHLAGQPILVVNSHADWDHAWGNAYFTGEHAAPILAHEYGRTRLLSEQAHVELADYQRRYPQFSSVSLVPATLTFTTGVTIYGGDLTIELFPAPGHHLDHIVAWIPQLRLLLAFDAVEDPIPCLENADSVPAMFATLEGFLTLQPQSVLCSHGKTSSPDLVKTNLAYLQEIERRCRSALKTHHPSSQELEYPATLLNYPLSEAMAGASATIDHTFYCWVHDHNLRSMFQWLMR